MAGNASIFKDFLDFFVTVQTAAGSASRSPGSRLNCYVFMTESSYYSMAFPLHQVWMIW